MLIHAKRPRATAANAVYGNVEGVYRGETHHCEPCFYCFIQIHERTDAIISAIHRGHSLPKRIDDGDKCQKHFLEAANSIIAKVSVY